MTPTPQSPDPTAIPQTTSYLAVSQSGYIEHLSRFVVVDINYADAPNTWAQEKYHVESIHEPPKPQQPRTNKATPDKKVPSSKQHCQRCRMCGTICDRKRPCKRCKYAGIGADGCFSEEDWAQDHYVNADARLQEDRGERYVHVSSLVWLEPYKRPMKITLQCPGFFNTETEMQILAADDHESVVQRAMLEDAHRTAQAKQCQLDISHMPICMYQPYCIAAMTDDKTKKKYWWWLLVSQTHNVKVDVEGRRVPTEQEEQEREWLGQKQWSTEHKLRSGKRSMWSRGRRRSLC
jgi:hypothetical protein